MGRPELKLSIRAGSQLGKLTWDIAISTAMLTRVAAGYIKMRIIVNINFYDHNYNSRIKMIFQQEILLLDYWNMFQEEYFLRYPKYWTKYLCHQPVIVSKIRLYASSVSIYCYVQMAYPTALLKCIFKTLLGANTIFLCNNFP